MLQVGAGAVTLATEGGGGQLTVPPGFQAKTRGQGCIISGTCIAPDADSWVAAGDLLRVSAAPDLQSFQLIDRSVLIGANITSGAGKDSMVLPYGLMLDTVANGGIYATLSVAQAAGAVLTVDVNRNGTSIFSTRLTFDNNERSTLTAAAPPVLVPGGEILANRVMSASKNRVYDSNVTGVAPAGAATINVAGNGIRYRENKILFVDTFEWDHTVPSAGINYEQLLSLSLLVSDSRGRSFLWKGTVSVVLWDGAWESRTRGSMEWRGVPYAVKFNGVGRLLIGGHDGKIWRSDDRGQSWTLTASPTESTPYYTRSFDYNERDQVLVACGHYVARSLDGGATWSRSYTPYDSAWTFVKWIPEWNIFIVVGAGSYTRRILTLNAGGAAPSNKSNTGNYYNVVYSAMFDRAVCLPHAESGGSLGYAVCTGDPTNSAWSYYTPPAGVNIRSRYGAASLPNGEIWTVGLDTSTSTEGYVISRDGGLTFERPIIPDSLPGVTAGYNRPGMIAYDETLRLLVIEPFLSGPGVGSARQFISRDNGATFQPTDIPAPLNGTNMARPEGVQWSPSAGCIIGSDSDTNPTIYFSRTGLFK